MCLRSAVVDCEPGGRGRLGSAPATDGDPTRSSMCTNKAASVHTWPSAHFLNVSVPLFTHAQNGNMSDNPVERSVSRLNNSVHMICFASGKCRVTCKLLLNGFSLHSVEHSRISTLPS